MLPCLMAKLLLVSDKVGRTAISSNYVGNVTIMDEY